MDIQVLLEQRTIWNVVGRIEGRLYPDEKARVCVHVCMCACVRPCACVC